MDRSWWFVLAALVAVVSISFVQFNANPQVHEDCEIQSNYVGKNEVVVKTSCGTFLAVSVNPFKFWETFRELDNAKGEKFDFETTGYVFPYIDNYKPSSDTD